MSPTPNLLKIALADFIVRAGYQMDRMFLLPIPGASILEESVADFNATVKAADVPAVVV